MVDNWNEEWQGTNHTDPTARQESLDNEWIMAFIWPQ
jgi:hypothetical protein